MNSPFRQPHDICLVVDDLHGQRRRFLDGFEHDIGGAIAHADESRAR